MSENFVLKVFFVGLLGLVLAFDVFSRYDTEYGDEALAQNGQ